MPLYSTNRSCEEGLQCVRCLCSLRGMKDASKSRLLVGERYKFHRTYCHNKFRWLPTEKDKMCGRCYLHVSKVYNGQISMDAEDSFLWKHPCSSAEKQTQVKGTLKQLEKCKDRMTMSFSSCTKSVTECGICGGGDNLIKVPAPARVTILLRHNHFVHKNTKVCAEHLRGCHLKDEVEVTHKPLDRSVVEEEDMRNLWSNASTLLNEASSVKWINVNTLSDDDAKAIIGWSNEVLDEMMEYLKGMKNSHCRSIREALVMFWLRVRCDWPYQLIARSFRYPHPLEEGTVRVSEAVNSVLQRLVKHFCPENIGARHWSYEDAVKEQTIFSRTLFADGHPIDKVIALVWDATYTYHHKSKYFKMSRQLFSVPKHLNLTKHMSVQFPTGKSFDTYGPFFANGKNNDAAMTEKILGFDPPDDPSHEEEHEIEEHDLKKDPEWQHMREWIKGAIKEGYKVVFVV
eukprot:Lithocolla_globosa_v1_NODE_1879_length_2278_cov_180.232569.p1 type:complete len:458 gc:universal NODE_1879_length_2278_cov_180.232569:2249-876(-)